MKKAILILFGITQIGFAQNKSADARIEQILSEKNDDKRMDELFVYLNSISDTDPIATTQTAKKVLLQSREKHDRLGEAFAVSQLGNQLYKAGNTTKSLELALKSLKIAEETDNLSLLAIVKNRLALNYTDQDKAIIMYSNALHDAQKTGNNKLKGLIAVNLGAAFGKIKRQDSALVYLQKAEQYNLKANYDYFKSFNYAALGNVFADMKNYTMASACFDLAIQESKKAKSPRMTGVVYSRKAAFLYETNQIDSSAAYAKKAIDAVQNTPFLIQVIPPAKLLMDIYRGKDDHLALYYSDMYRVANDSINSLKAIEQSQLMILDEEMRQQELKQQHEDNLQYILIAGAILFLVSLLILLSRGFIPNPKYIRFLGAIALLIMFEFINLLLGPFIGKITHSPVTTLLICICLSAMIGPLQGIIEGWAIKKLIEKNNAIRLSNAKKTIEELEEKS